LQEKAKNQVLQPEEKANTDAIIQVAEQEIKNLRAQQTEAINIRSMKVADHNVIRQYDNTIQFDTLDDSTLGFNVPDESYNTELMSFARQILAPARYEKLKANVRGYHQTVDPKQINKSKIAVDSITNTKTLAHEIGHATDYILNNNTFPNTLTERFAGNSFTNQQLIEEAKKASALVRPIDKWTPYRLKAEELMADVHALYLMDNAKLKDIAPNLYGLVADKFNRSSLNTLINDTIKSVTYNKPSEKAQAIHAQATIEYKDPLAKDAMNLVGSMVVRSMRRKSAAIADALFKTREWTKNYNETELENVGALVEGINNIRTGETPVRTDKLAKLEKIYRYEIEKVREQINVMMTGVGDSQYIKFIENYLPHFYVFDKKKFATFSHRHFNKKIKSALPRTMPTLKDAVDAGLVPLTQNVAKLYQKYVEVNVNAAYNAELVKNIYHESARLEIPFLTKTQTHSGQIKIDHPAFQTIFATKNDKGETMLWRQGAWIDKDAYRPLRQILEKPFDNVVLKTLLKTTALMKHTSLTLSFFHYANITESAQAVLSSLRNPLGGIITKFNGKPMFSYKAGQALMNEPAVVKDALLHGWQGDPFADAMTGTVKNMYEQLEAKLSKVPVAKKLARTIRKGNEMLQNTLWNKYVTPLTLYSYWKLTNNVIAKAPATMTAEQLSDAKQTIAEYLSDAFGGQEWSKKYWATPKTRQIMQLLVMAPDYTMSNFNIALKRPFEAIQNKYKGYYSKTYRESHPDFVMAEKMKTKLWAGYWVHMLLTVYGFMAVLQMALGGPPPEENEPGKEWYSDVTPIFKLMEKIIPGFDAGERRYYIGPGKQFREVVRYFTDPLEIIGAKMSPLARLVFEQFTKHSAGTGWPTDFAELEWYESLGPRALNAMDKFIPFSLQGSNFLMTFPLSKGMSWYTAQKAYEDIMRAQVDPTLYNKLMGPDNAQSLKERIDKAAIDNGLDPEEQWNSARSKVRTEYYTKFWESLNENEMKKVDEYARILAMLEVNEKGLKSSGRNRDMTDEQIEKALKELVNATSLPEKP
jgi:hypothetical protein